MKSLENSNKNIVETGNILISEPFLPDPNFNRSIVLICDDQKGHLGFVLNKSIELSLHEFMNIQAEVEFPVFVGGPVSQNSLHFLHRRPDLISGGKKIAENIYWGGNFETVNLLMKNNGLMENDIRFFVGYSGWTSGQLISELQEKSWIVSNIDQEMLFENSPDDLWKLSLNKLGGYYRLLANSPENPQYN